MKYVTEAAFQKMITLQKGYIDTLAGAKQDKFTVGRGLQLQNGELSVTLDTSIFKVVDSLPDQPAKGDENKIHLVLTNTGKTGNEYTEYLWVNGKWEEFGTFKADIDLTPYLKAEELTSSVSNNAFEILKRQATLAKIVFGTTLKGTVSNGNILNLELAEVLSADQVENFYKVQVDKYGRVISVTVVAEADIKALGFSTTKEVNQAIEAEKTRAEGVENTLTGNISTINGKIGTLEQADKTLKGEIDQVSEAQQQDLQQLTALAGKLNGVESVSAELDKKADKTTVEGIEEKIPTQASASNQLADKDFVNSSIATNTAEFKGTHNSLEELEKQTADANDYGFVVSKDEAGNTVYKRYKYVEGEGWKFEFELNNSSFTAEQWAAIQSKITEELVEKLKALPVASDILTSKQAAVKYQPAGDYVTKTEFDVLETLVETLNQGLGQADLEIEALKEKIAEYAYTIDFLKGDTVQEYNAGKSFEITAINLINIKKVNLIVNQEPAEVEVGTEVSENALLTWSIEKTNDELPAALNITYKLKTDGD